jgi:DNA-binding NtrC family response regulator
MVTFDCGAISGRRFGDDELFGQRKGTNKADESCDGAFARAKGATLFLDEVDELPLDAQAALVRALEARDIVPFSERRATDDVRLIAATDRDLAELVRLGKFRQDLYERLSTVHLRVPPLRELRQDSTPPLAADEPANADQRARTGYARG